MSTPNPAAPNRGRWFFILFVAVAGLTSSATGLYKITHPPDPQVNADNVQEYIKTWCENLGLAFTQQSLPNSLFGFTVTTRSGTHVTVSRRTDRLAYLQFEDDLVFVGKDQEMFKKLDDDEMDTVEEEVSIALSSRRDVGFTYGVPGGQRAVAMQEAAPIKGLTEDRFASYIDDMEFSNEVAKDATDLALKKITKPHPAGQQ